MTYIPESRQLRQPAELKHLLSLLKDAVLNQQLVQVRANRSGMLDPAIESVCIEGPWPDVIEMRFKDLGTSDFYSLSVETYHGAGGSWRKE